MRPTALHKKAPACKTHRGFLGSFWLSRAKEAGGQTSFFATTLVAVLVEQQAVAVLVEQQASGQQSSGQQPCVAAVNLSVEEEGQQPFLAAVNLPVEEESEQLARQLGARLEAMSEGALLSVLFAR
jgi:hypothetical protein